ncbi:hypothetical protein [Cupriavidus consociatus]|uniref:hypothetical protein n=1 Tax=Cupriavidus consociatus TaxID=2821357 RepID=UPI001AEB597D|nr:MULTISPECIES: hypothetical protein [unclassified Cupriavidus]MBP0625093.1 hypothetical protein [Cupriavidus sp. LEh25]MDK2661831.1 hypothetical protein [Cupriavidus sp. LEh21]
MVKRIAVGIFYRARPKKTIDIPTVERPKVVPLIAHIESNRMTLAISPNLRLRLSAGGMMALLLAAGGAHSEPEHTSPKPVSELAYSSAFAAYKGYADQPVTSWREANDIVGRIGGWRTYAKEAVQETSPAAIGSAPAPASQGDGRSAHKEAGHE